METSRVVVKGLPPSLTEADFRSHFSQKFSLTDCRYFPSRRLGFVGFPSSENATEAVKYFNKSFLRMSRIRVEPAINNEKSDQVRAVTQPQVGRTALSNREGTGDQHNALKRKRGHETTSLPRPLRDDSRNVNMSDPLDVSENSQEPQPVTVGDTLHEDPNVQEHSLNNRNGNPPSPDSPANSSEKLPDDENWMRSRTTRLLGLDDDGDDDASDVTGDKELKRPLQASNSDVSQQNGNPVLSREASPEATDSPGDLSKTDRMRSLASGSDVSTNRLFVRNLPFTTKNDDLRDLFRHFGDVTEVTTPQNFRTGNSKGIAFIQFKDQSDAMDALKRTDGSIFQGRLLHVMPANHKPDERSNERDLSQVPLKKRRMAHQKSQNASSTFNWNHMFMNIDAVMASVANSLGVAKSALLDPSSADGAVKQAQAETHVIQETKAYLEKRGVNLQSFESSERSGNALLVKNFPYGTTADELRSLFSSAGDIKQVVVPPTGTIAIVEFAYADQAKHARHAFAYRKFKGSVIYPEQAPSTLFSGKVDDGQARDVLDKPATSESSLPERPLMTSTLFVRNLNFSTTNERLREVFGPLQGFWSARVKTKPDPKNKGKTLSMGFGFLEFKSKGEAQAALEAMSGFTLDGHRLEIKESHNGNDVAEQRRQEDLSKKRHSSKTKLVIKNLPFETTKKDVSSLFKSYGQLKTVRLPKKIDNTRKGFAFAEFTSPREAENALSALRNTHLLGRRLVLDYAAEEAEDPEEQIAKMQQKMGRQAGSVALQRLAASDRRKFTLDTGGADASD